MCAIRQTTRADRHILGLITFGISSEIDGKHSHALANGATRRTNRRPAYIPHNLSGALTISRRVIELLQIHEDGYERH